MASEMDDPGPSRTEYVFERVRADLLEGRLQPGERLRLPGLAKRFAVSMTVVREALTRLAEQRLVVSNPKRGFAVVALSVADLKDLTYARVRLETMILRDSIEFGGIKWESAVVGAHHAMNRTPYLLDDGTQSPAWMKAHRGFHHALGSGCASQRLIAIADAQRDSAELYRAWSRSLAHDTERDIAGEHNLIVSSGLDRDVDAATAALTAHIERTSAVLLDYAAKVDTTH